MAAAQQRRRNRERIGVDSKCEELARHFLSDFDANKPEDTTKLAEAIQVSVERFIAERFLERDEALTDVQRSIRDGSFGVKSASEE